MKTWKASAPSNIAIIKYMGKEVGQLNQATNPSLSMTLKNFRTEVQLTISPAAAADHWEPLANTSPLRRESTQKFVQFFHKLKEKQGIKENFLIQSGNNFPSDAGLASSASSFAALTTCAYEAFSDLKKTTAPNALELANISRTGSGSSCRSFFSPWCAWEGEKIYQVESNLEPLVDLVLILSTDFKKVSSSEAHQRVSSSPLFTGRKERVEKRMELAKICLVENNFSQLSALAWEEMWEMHSLFHTSNPPFFYFAPQTMQALRFVENYWEKYSSGPLCTIDAGPNVHLLCKTDEREKILSELKQNMPGIKVIESYA